MASTIKVDNVQNQPGTNVVNKCGTTVNIGAASDNIRSAGNNLQASDGGNLISQCGTTITLGASGDTISLASGASQTGFGRTGTVDWQTGDIKTAAFIPAAGKGYFVNTTGGAVTVNLPAGTAGDIIGLKDYANTWDSNAVTLNPNGSEKIGGGNDQDPTLSAEGGSVLLVYVDTTQGWLTTEHSVTASPSGIENFITATGGVITCSGDFKIHTFTGPGTFCVSGLATAPANNIVSYMVIAGGGGKSSGGAGPGGGGGGGFREFKAPNPGGGCYTASPLASACTGLTVTATGYPVTVGAAGGTVNGSASIFNCKTSAGGGEGNHRPNPGVAGGSGGGGSDYGPTDGGAGNTPPVSPPQGNPGFRGAAGENSGSGGGAGSGGPVTCTSAHPGNGTPSAINGSAVVYAVGGDGEGGNDANAPNRGTGYGHGSGGTFPGSPQPQAVSEAGAVIIRYRKA